MNTSHLKGNLTRDIEIRYNGVMAVAKTSIATNRKFISNGERKEETMFIDLVFFGKSAETANQYLNKGSTILLTGRLSFSQWVDRNGVKQSKHEIVVESMEFINTRTKSPQDLNTQNMPQSSGTQNTTPALDIDDDEVPF